jgi:hypothetical protein
VSFKSQSGTSATFRLLVKGEDAGTWFKPDVEVLHKHATTSPFGRGEETVIDPTYRNGTELKADELAFGLKEDRELGGCYGWFLGDIREELQTSMFVGKSVTLQFYKLTIYGEGGHFDWHRDSTHSDAHHGTVLVALNTEWEGGNLMLRHHGVETVVDMHPTTSRSKKSGDMLKPVVVAFFTDTEHKVMPVTKGTRLVLQYDVEVEQTSDSDSDSEIVTPNYTPLDEAVERHEHVTYESRTITYPNLDPKLFQAIVDEIRVLQEEGSTPVAFPLTHLYRKASIKKENLKGTDSALFNALKNHFNVFLHPVLIRAVEDGSECYREENIFAHEYKSIEEKHAKKQRRAVHTNASFHLPRFCAILQLSLPNWIYLGNSAEIIGEARYYGAGMFVEPKSEE